MESLYIDLPNTNIEIYKDKDNFINLELRTETFIDYLTISKEDLKSYIDKLQDMYNSVE